MGYKYNTDMKSFKYSLRGRGEILSIEMWDLEGIIFGKKYESFLRCNIMQLKSK